MSIYITKSDYAESIRENILDQIIELNDLMLDVSETRAIDLMQSYLSGKYDVAIIFARTGSERNPILVMYAIDIALYDLHSRINPRKVPQHRIDRYENAIKWLEQVSKGVIKPVNMPLLPVDAPTAQTGTIKYGSNPKRDNQY
jgi:phage gp36-like protein